jgi:hypothetical protein
MIIMRYLATVITSLLAVAIGHCVLAQESPAVAQASVETKIQIGCRDVDGNKSAGLTAIEKPMSMVGVRHGLPFELLIMRCDIPEDEIAGCWLALTDSGVHKLEHRSLIHQCDYYVPVYGIAIVKLESGEYVTHPFFVHASWKKEEKDSIPNERPLPVFPETEDPALRSILVDWWNTVVLSDVLERYSGSIALEPVE